MIPNQVSASKHRSSFSLNAPTAILSPRVPVGKSEKYETMSTTSIKSLNTNRPVRKKLLSQRSRQSSGSGLSTVKSANLKHKLMLS